MILAISLSLTIMIENKLIQIKPGSNLCSQQNRLQCNIYTACIINDRLQVSLDLPNFGYLKSAQKGSGRCI